MLPDDIATERLLMRQFRFSDVPEVFSYLQEPDMGLFLEGAAAPPTLAETEAIIARHLLADREQRSVYAITIEDQPVGGISINFAKAHRIAEIGYSINKALWGRGFAREAVQALIDAAFDNHPELQRIQANIHPLNAGSIRVAINVGMQYEGTLRSGAYVRGAIADEAIYAIIRSPSAEQEAEST